MTQMSLSDHTSAIGRNVVQEVQVGTQTLAADVRTVDVGIEDVVAEVGTGVEAEVPVLVGDFGT